MEDVFLATTAIREFWKEDEELVYLGWWCVRRGLDGSLRDNSTRVMPCPWDDRRRYHEGFRYADACSERLLGRLTTYLNRIHGVRQSERYWRIVIGPWLFHFVHSLYDRYIHLQEALRRYSLTTVVLDGASFMTPRDADQGIHWLGDDRYNLQLYSQLLALMGHRFPSKPWPEGRPASWEEEEKASWRQKLRWLFGSGMAKLVMRAASLVRTGKPLVLLCDMSMPTGTLLRLVRKSGLVAVPLKMPWSTESNPRQPSFDDHRLGLGELESLDEFEHWLVKTLPQNFPVLYLEGYRSGRETARKLCSKKPAAIVSETGWYLNDPFKFFAAEASDRHAPLIAVQHGGGYGILRLLPHELHESRVADAYHVWGWAGQEGAVMHNWPSPRLSMLASRGGGKTARKSGKILFVATVDFPYLYRFHSRPVGSQWKAYGAWQLRFFGSLSSELRSVIRFRAQGGRFGQADFGKSFLDAVNRLFPEVRRDERACFADSAAEANLVIFDNCGTGFLETLAANMPTLLFWDPKIWEVREAAAPYVDRLRDAGVLIDTPEGAAEKLAAIILDPAAWWSGASVQDARREFVNRFALYRQDWMEAWVRGLQELCGTPAGVTLNRQHEGA